MSGLGTLSSLLQENERARQVSCALPDGNCEAAPCIFDILMMPALSRTTPDERSSTRCRIANQLLTKSHEPVRTDLDEEGQAPTRSSKTKTLVDCSGRLRTLACGLRSRSLRGWGFESLRPHTFACTKWLLSWGDAPTVAAGQLNFRTAKTRNCQPRSPFPHS